MATEPAVGFVAAPVATLWSDPAAVRPVDAPALASRADLAAWVSAMDRDQRVGDCVVSQLLLGERVLVEEVRPDGWARVVAVEQPAAPLDPRGYPGWLPAAQLASGALPEPSLVVDAVETALLDAPGGRIALPGVGLGTRLAPAGPPVGGFQPVHVPGHDGPLWAPPGSVVPLPDGAPATETLALARRLLDAVYVWGGMSAHGIDCSGLVHLAWRRFGVSLPRDADDQACATQPVPPGAERPGDLYFFARPGRPVHHVGLVSDRGPGHMLHACYQRRIVIEEPMPPDRAATLVATHRVRR
ncbi:C40 family peptidase [Phytohabitans sp. ZYX-F-186]|uniref:C40 family peptidase n=1 Tax=Phytohabitans maris TaxID=3071409 RepID=A0ABU0ZT46_9ACTN|nr:C40 family peptidase [Phytohabitans sp. ZYX-F-186]MDQ7909647.1 C40 family peptidase [Phytohabitans sp. ZYX-F-186]